MNHTTLTDEDVAIKAAQCASLDAPSAEQDETDFAIMRARFNACVSPLRIQTEFAHAYNHVSEHAYPIVGYDCYGDWDNDGAQS